ncbi:RNA polymerase subunit sigma-54 [Siminovitchia terrae]|uniref:sigma-54 interaction domain-containing protein n=1 Tax=Siminovitchia terrae TaxID=1914933 RepID=UPI001AFE3CC4|nr:sigma 54-interacting transcriptional regulator [Siminovitchia terrae]GIN92380.1 RNA polymerase subunit sigma-54 [Siminovitchia terrae]
MHEKDSLQKVRSQILSYDSKITEMKNDHEELPTAAELLKAITEGDGSIKMKEIIDIITDTPPSKSIDNHEYIKMIESPIFGKLIDSLYDGIYITDGNGVTVKVNKAYERITGLNRAELIGHHMEDVVTSGLINKSVSLQVIKEKRPITLMQIIKQERKIIVSGMPVFNEENDVLFVVTNVRDVTELLHLKLELEELQKIKELKQVSKELSGVHSDPIIISEESREMFFVAEKVAKTNAKVLLQGETGVGKSVVARYIHDNSSRKHAPFLELNCGALPPSLIEAELFGYEPGAFTGALAKGKKGLLEIAHNGTLFLDEIGELPLEIQAKLLKVIEDQAFIPIGSTKVKKIDIRIISATLKNLRELVNQGKFREDLFYRLHVVPIEVPPLRKRKKELLLLIEHYIEDFNRSYGWNKHISVEALELLQHYAWPGNIRELKNVIERMMIMVANAQMDVSDLPIEIRDAKHDQSLLGEEIIPLKDAVERVEKHYILKAMKEYKTTRKAAEVLQISQPTIVQKMKKWQQID